MKNRANYQERRVSNLTLAGLVFTGIPTLVLGVINLVISAFIGVLWLILSITSDGRVLVGFMESMETILGVFEIITGAFLMMLWLFFLRMIMEDDSMKELWVFSVFCLILGSVSATLAFLTGIGEVLRGVPAFLSIGLGVVAVPWIHLVLLVVSLCSFAINEAVTRAKDRRLLII